MSNKVLYYPYINVPESIWFTRILLYWDKVGAIIPYDYLEDPEKLNTHTRDLVKAELVQQVMPGEHLWKIPSFRESFLKYLNSQDKVLIEKRRKSFEDDQYFSIHIEKMDDLEFELQELGLAKERNYPWFNVEKETANEFMAYLAASLGKIENLNFTPVSDDISNLQNFINSSGTGPAYERKVSNLRIQILEDLFPAPIEPLNADKIHNFKEKHIKKLSRLRIAVEKEITNIADMNDDDLRQRRLDLFKEEINDSIEEIKSELNKSGYKRLSLSKIGSIVTSLPGVPKVFGLAKAVYEAFNKSEITNIDVTLLYAAIAQKELLNT